MSPPPTASACRRSWPPPFLHLHRRTPPRPVTARDYPVAVAAPRGGAPEPPIRGCTAQCVLGAWRPLQDRAPVRDGHAGSDGGEDRADSTWEHHATCSAPRRRR